jgi:hypothetical protein
VGALLVRLYDEFLRLIARYRRSTPRFGCVVVLRTYDGTVLNVQDDQVRGSGFAVDGGATFVLVDPASPHRVTLGGRVRYGQPIGLRSTLTGAFWGVNYDDARILNCNSGALGEWETFELELVGPRRLLGSRVRFDDRLAIRSFSRWAGDEWTYLQYELETSHLCRAGGERVGGWETFLVTPGPV